MIYAPFAEYGAITKALEEKGMEILNSGFERIPMDTKTITEEQQADVEKLIEKVGRGRRRTGRLPHQWPDEKTRNSSDGAVDFSGLRAVRGDSSGPKAPIVPCGLRPLGKH